LAVRYQKYNTQLHLRHLSVDCRKVLSKASRYVEDDGEQDPHYGLAVDYD